MLLLLYLNLKGLLYLQMLSICLSVIEPQCEIGEFNVDGHCLRQMTKSRADIHLLRPASL